MLVMIDRIDKMTDIVKQGANFEQQSLFRAQAVKRIALIEELTGKFGGQRRVRGVELVFPAQLHGRFPNLLTTRWMRIFSELICEFEKNAIFQAHVGNRDLPHTRLAGDELQHNRGRQDNVGAVGPQFEFADPLREAHAAEVFDQILQLAQRDQPIIRLSEALLTQSAQVFHVSSGANANVHGPIANFAIKP